MLSAFETGAEGVFIAGCGNQCARENTTYWIQQRVEKVRKVLAAIGLEPERLQTFALDATVDDPAEELDRFIEKIGALRLTSVLKQEVKS